MSNVSMVPGVDERNAAGQPAGQDNMTSGPDTQSDIWRRLSRDVAFGGTSIRLLQEAFQHAFGGILKPFEDGDDDPAKADAGASPANAAPAPVSADPSKDGVVPTAAPDAADQTTPPADPNRELPPAPIAQASVGATAETAPPAPPYHPLDPVTGPVPSQPGSQRRSSSGHFHRVQLGPADDPTVIVDGFYASLSKVEAALGQAAALKPMAKTGVFDPAKVLQRGYFANAPGADAQNTFVFMDPLTGKPVMGPDGQPVSFSKDQIVAAGTAARSQKVTIRVPSVGNMQVTEADRLKLQYPSDLQDRATEIGNKELDALSMFIGPAGKLIEGGVWTWRAIQAFRAYRAYKRLTEPNPKDDIQTGIDPETPAADQKIVEQAGNDSNIPSVTSQPSDATESKTSATSLVDLSNLANTPTSTNRDDLHQGESSRTIEEYRRSDEQKGKKFDPAEAGIALAGEIENMLELGKGVRLEFQGRPVDIMRSRRGILYDAKYNPIYPDDFFQQDDETNKV